MNKSERYTVFSVLKKVINEKAYLNIALKKIDKSNNRDISFITSLSNSVLENLSQIDFIIDKFVSGKRVHTQIRIILRMALCEILFMKTPERAAVNEAVNLSIEIGKVSLKGFVNAVLRNFLKEKDNIDYPKIEKDLKRYLEVFSGYKKWFIDEIIEDYGEDFAKEFLLYERNDKDYTHIRLNTLTAKKDEIVNSLNHEDLIFKLDEGINFGANVKNLTSIETRDVFKSGMITVQGKASMLTVKLIGIEKSMSVLDACAAPGGKSAYMSELMENQGEITAFDIHPHRVELIEKNMDRLNCSNVKAKVKDASEFDESLKEKFDVVFLDMPCSSMGLAYKKADIRYAKDKEDIDNLVSLQKKILNACKNYVKIGGILMYVTCSITRQETDLNWFFKKNNNFEELDLDMPENIEYVKLEHGIKLFPHISKMDGFFICKMRKS